MFSDNDRKNILIGSLLVILLTVACVATIRFYKSSVPEQVDRNTTNITSDEYRQASEKWQARNVEEYELVLHSDQNDITLRVNSKDDTIEVVEHIFRGEPISSLNWPAGSGPLRLMTVERLFELASQGLGATQQGSGEAPEAEYSSFFDSTVRFDQDLGYPSYFASYRRTTRPSREIVWRETMQAPIEIRSVKIIR